MFKNFSVTISILFVLCFCTCQNYEPVDMVFKDVNIISMTTTETDNNIMYRSSIYVSDGVIKEIGSFDELKYPKGTTILECSDKYLMPGFADMHVHMYYEEEATLFLANGVTLIRNMWGYPEHLKMKEKIKNRQFLAPELYTTGPIIDGTGSYWPESLIITDPETVSDKILEMKDVGYDAIKVYTRLKLDVYDAIIEAAQNADIPVVGHVPRRVGVFHAIESGQQSIEHLTGYPSSTVSDKLIEVTVTSGVWLCPTLIVLKNYENITQLQSQSIPELIYVNPAWLERWEKADSYNKGFIGYQKNMKILYDNGANIVAGTDCGNPYVIAGFSLHDEFQLMYDAGLSPYQVLLTATVNPAKMLGIEDRVGTIEVGKEADLVLLDKNPLKDIDNTRSIAGVMTKGFWLSKEDLQSLLKKIADNK